MKQLTFLLVTFIFVVCFSCKKKAENEQITSKITFQVPIRNNDVELDWWIRNIEGPQREQFVSFLFENKLGTPFSIQPFEIDSLCSEFKKGDSLIIDQKSLVKYLSSIEFEESWNFNPITLEVTKEVKSFSPCLSFSEMGIPYVLNPVLPKKGIKADKHPFVVTSKIQYDVPIINKEQNREWYQENIEKSSREKFLNIVFDVVFNGKTDVYNMFSEKLDKNSLDQIYSHRDTLAIADPNDPDIYYDTVIVTKLKYNDISRLRFLEEWSIDKINFKFYKRVIGICPLQAAYDELGSFKGYIPLFWIYFDKNILNSN